MLKISLGQFNQLGVGFPGDLPGLIQLFGELVETGGGPVEVVRRRGDGRSYLFVVNHGDDTATVRASGFDLITQAPVDGAVPVPPGAVRIIREECAS